MPSSDTVRCKLCGLVQFFPDSAVCRRCKEPMTILKFLDDKFPIWRSQQPISSMMAAASRPMKKRNFALELGQLLKRLRKERGLKREDMRSVMQPSSLSRIESGAHYPSIDTLEKFADVFEMTIPELLSSIQRPTSFETPDRFVNEMVANIRTLRWSQWLEVIIAMKTLSTQSGVGALNYRASLEQRYVSKGAACV